MERRGQHSADKLSCARRGSTEAGLADIVKACGIDQAITPADIARSQEHSRTHAAHGIDDPEAPSLGQPLAGDDTFGDLFSVEQHAAKRAGKQAARSRRSDHAAPDLGDDIA